MRFLYDSSVSVRQRHLTEQAISLCSYPLDLIDVEVTFSVVDEPTCPGHQDYMCTTETVTGMSGTAAVQIRTAADDPQAQVNFVNGRRTQDEVDQFFMESIIHELGHCVTFIFIQDDTAKTTVAGLFHKSGPTGEGNAQGVLADWNPLGGKWEDRIQEAVAEVFKDTYLADQYRLYDNRTNWDLTTSDHTTLMRMLLPTNTYSLTGYIPMRGNSGDFAAPPLNDLGGVVPSVGVTDWYPIGAGVPDGPWYASADPYRTVQGGPLEGYDHNQPLIFVVRYGYAERMLEWSGGVAPPDYPSIEAFAAGVWDDADARPDVNYSIHAKLTDARNGVIYEETFHADASTTSTVVEREIRPAHPLDIGSLKGVVDMVGGFPVSRNGGYSLEVVGSMQRNVTALPQHPNGSVPGGTPAEMDAAFATGLFAYYSTTIQDQLPDYPYKDPSINAQAKALGAINLARARAALH